MEQASAEERDRTKNKITHYPCKYLAKNINFKKKLSKQQKFAVHNKNSRIQPLKPE